MMREAKAAEDIGTDGKTWIMCGNYSNYGVFIKDLKKCSSKTCSLDVGT